MTVGQRAGAAEVRDGSGARSPQVGPTDVPGFAPGSAYPVPTRLLINALSGGAFVAAILLSPFYWLTFWFAAELVRAAFGWDGHVSPAIPFVPSVLASWGTLYLATDRLALIGNAALRLRLARKARRYFGGARVPRVPRFFVEARSEKGRWRLLNDHGWLFLLPDRLLFVGDRQAASVPRGALACRPEREENPFRLGPTWVVAELAYPWGRMRLLPRDHAARLSETHSDALRLEAALSDWFGSPPPAPAFTREGGAGTGHSSTETQPPDAAER